MEFKGTKGEWHVISPFNNEDHLLLDENSFQIGIIQEEYIQDPVKIKANAKLITCAPEMLESLQSIIKEYDLDIVQGIDAKKIRELIKKATTI